MTDPKLLAQAQRGDAIALQTLLNNSLRPYGIWARIDRQAQLLNISLESTQAPDPDAMAARVRSGMERLKPHGISEITLSGWALGETEPTWKRQILLEHSLSTTTSEAKVATRGYTPISLSPPPEIQPGPSDAALKLLVAHSQSQGAPRRSLQPQPLAGLRPPKRRPNQPFVLKWSDFDPMMLAIIGCVAVYGFLGARNPSYEGPFIWLHFPNLAIHETGHLLFMPFGHFLMLLGGSLTQIAFPAVFTGYFFYSQQYFSSALTLFWTGQNFMDVAVYMADAPYRALPLTNPDIDAHDWWQLFNLMNCLNQAELIAGITHWIGVLIYLMSIVAGTYVAYLHKQKLEAEQRRREERLRGLP